MYLSRPEEIAKTLMMMHPGEYNPSLDVVINGNITKNQQNKQKILNNDVTVLMYYMLSDVIYAHPECCNHGWLQHQPRYHPTPINVYPVLPFVKEDIELLYMFVYREVYHTVRPLIYECFKEGAINTGLRSGVFILRQYQRDKRNVTQYIHAVEKAVHDHIISPLH